MASVLFGRPEARTTRTASETSSPTSSPVPIGVTLNATSTDMPHLSRIPDPESRSLIPHPDPAGLLRKP
ncbi:hypothetical protein GCM10017559_77620 [Streptosporangium longisporum]|uniref:Uncharacterized protein n=1 Tax=Streptosporangium longisporum TaxID=46187 RepID=A0ABP6LAS3_9ACTN